MFSSLVDIDECELDTDNCDVNANCTDTDGSFNCTCNQGYEGDGVNCTGTYVCVSATIDYLMVQHNLTEILNLAVLIGEYIQLSDVMIIFDLSVHVAV